LGVEKGAGVPNRKKTLRKRKFDRRKGQGEKGTAQLPRKLCTEVGKNPSSPVSKGRRQRGRAGHRTGEFKRGWAANVLQGGHLAGIPGERKMKTKALKSKYVRGKKDLNSNVRERSKGEESWRIKAKG